MLVTLALAVALVLLAVVGGAYVYDRARSDVIAAGVTVDGVPVGGMNEADARAKLERELVGRVSQPVSVSAGARTWTLSAQEAHLNVALGSMLAQALSASRNGFFLTRAARDLFGGAVHRNVAAQISYSHQAVRKLTAQVRAVLDRPAQDASVQPTATGLNTVPARSGVVVASHQLGVSVEAALVGSLPSRTVNVPLHTIRPRLSTSQLAARYPAFIVVDRGSFRLKFYDHLKLSKTYEIAVGMEGLETPAGMYHIQWEQVNPPWYVPKKAWAGSLAGTVVPPGPSDPLKARFMSFDGGAGIHGIDPSEYSSIGHNASHGCVRMRIPDVISLYSVSPVGTPVYII